MPAPPTEDYYELLGLHQGCTEKQIKREYRRLSLKVHPDRWSPDSTKMASAHIAFSKVCPELSLWIMWVKAYHGSSTTHTRRW
ncbi:DnaJ-domain-containing protein [Mollisia scopiformis]|uniref:DnaJ-domain-containing protein n=1 Tax=Mollisia scopiformis TaxID=149040 RepID=A0A132BC39_MOLSC|nr:DnaJ-domain-containing protein [Mollisia scopiformis]KUJ09990.1 DnaJ-domain-containing protein [Mollisia scopiformis]